MHETIAPDTSSICARMFVLLSRGTSDTQARMIARTLAYNATQRSVAIRLKGKGR